MSDFNEITFNELKQIVSPPCGAIALNFVAYTVLTDAVADVSHFTLTPKPPTAHSVIVRTSGLAGNLPKTYGNTIALWNGALPNMAVPPLKIVPFADDAQEKDIVIAYEFEQLLYSLTYQVGGLETMCALAQLNLTNTFLRHNNINIDHLDFTLDKCNANLLAREPLDAEWNVPTFVNLQILELTTSSVKVLYNTLSGYLPATYKNWLGVWQGQAIPYDAPTSLQQANITQDFNQGIVVLDNLTFSEYFTYTLIYFTGPDRTNAAALLYFNTLAKVIHD